MFFDEYGFVREAKSSSRADSARLAGLLETMGMRMGASLSKYFDYNGYPTRHPFSDHYPTGDYRTVSRDTLVCLASGLLAQGNYDRAKRIYDDCRFFAYNTRDEVDMHWKIPDPIGPHVRNHFRTCANLGQTEFGLWVLKKDIERNGKHAAMKEQNQIQCMVVTAGPKWVQYYVEKNPLWLAATKKYWVDDRVHYGAQEPLVVELIEGKISSYLK